MPATDILGKIGEKVGTEFSDLKVSLGNIYSTQVSLGNLASTVSTNTGNISTNTGNISTNTSNITNLQNASSSYATKVSLGQTRVSISNMLDGTTAFSDLSALRASIGDLTVTGTTTTLNTQTVEIEDNIIEVNLAPTTGNETAQTGGIQVNRGTGNDKAKLIWNDTTSQFQFKLGAGDASIEKVKVPSGSAIVINNVSLGNYSSFETQFNANK
jgi:hypothetical protein